MTRREELLALAAKVAILPPDLIERVARSLRVAYCSPGVPVTPWEELHEMAQGEWLEQAAATLAALEADDLRTLLALRAMAEDTPDE